MFLPPAELMEPIELPSRHNLRTVGDMVRVLLADEEAIALKNADLEALREYRGKLLEGRQDG